MIIWSIVALGVLSLIILLLESVREMRTFVTTRYSLQKSCGIKALVLSDLHDKDYGNHNQKIIEIAKKESPEAIFIAGDMLIGRTTRDSKVAEELMKELVKIAPVYYGNGNHEQRMRVFPEIYGKAYSEYKARIEKYGVRILENETIKIELGGESVYISGLEIPTKYYEKCKFEYLTKEEIDDLIGVKQDGYHILLAHNPVHCDAYVKWGADLVLSGHLHGGIIRLPWIGGIITPQVKLLPKYSGGMYQVEDSPIVVSKGLGEHTVKLRFLNRPELIVLEF